MADRFPLIVNESSRKIEEMISGDNLDMTGNGIAISGTTGTTGQYLKSDGGVVAWDNPGDVYLTLVQTITNKTFESSTISGSLNTFSNIPNTALVNKGITINGTTVDLGGTIVTPNDNTSYSVSAVDGLATTEKLIRLTGSDTVTSDVTFKVGIPATVPAGSSALSLALARVDSTITITGTVVDNDTVTRLQSFTGGTPQSGDVTIKGAGGATITQDTGTKTILIDTDNDDTITTVRAGTGQVASAGNFTFLEGAEVTLTQGVDANSDPTITVASVDTITRAKGGGSGSFVSGDIIIQGGSGGNVTVSQSGNTIDIDSQNDNTITKFGSTASNGTFSLAAGDFRLTASGDAELTQNTNSGTGVTTIDIGFTNTDTGAGLGAGVGLVLNSGDFELKNVGSLTDQALLKWDSSNGQLVNSVIQDNGTDVTIAGNLNVTGSTTTLESTILRVADPIIELRKGDSLVGADGGLQINRTSDSNGVVQTWIGLQWFESGAYFRTIDNGGLARRLVTETETQTLSNKTLDSPSFTGNTNIGVVTSTSINGLTISSTLGATLDFADAKTLTVSNTMTFQATDGTTINFGVGGSAGSSVAYTSNNLGAFASTTSTQLRSTLSDPTGSGQTVFNTSPNFVTGINTQSSAFSLVNAFATTINAFGAATDINIGADTGDTTISHNLQVLDNVTFNTDDNNTFTVLGVPNFDNADISIRGTDANVMTIGRGNSAVASNTALGVEVLSSNQGGSQNTGVGYQALATNNSGLGNVAVGDGAMRVSDVGDNNVAVGKDAMLTSEGGDDNVAVGNSSLYSGVLSSDNVCVGAFAGYNMTGNGNVLIGSGRTINLTNGPTYSPPSISGSNQLVIGTSSSFGQGTWITGDNTYNVTVPNGLFVGGALEVNGNLTVNGTTTTLNVQNISIDDRALELAAVATAPFGGNITSGSPVVSNVDSLTGIVPGMVVTVVSGTSLPVGTTTIISVDIVGSSITLSNNVSGASGTASFQAAGPTDEAANDGGLILKGTTVDKTILYDNDRVDKYWVFSENLELKSGRHFSINDTEVLSNTTLGSTVVNSSLTGVGTLSTLEVSGNVTCSGSGFLQLPSGTDNERPLTPAEGMLRWNDTTNIFEGYDGTAWGSIGGGAVVSSTAPAAQVQGDFWYDTDDGRLFIYYQYQDGGGNTVSQWVDASPNGTPTDLVVDGTGTFGGDLTVEGPAAPNLLLKVTNTQATNTNKAFTINNNDQTEGLDISYKGEILPKADADVNLGGPSNRWANIYSADLQLSNEGAANEVDGTWGQYTIQEGEEDLFLINRRSGKKYKFMLQEVN